MKLKSALIKFDEVFQQCKDVEIYKQYVILFVGSYTTLPGTAGQNLQLNLWQILRINN